MKKQVLFNNVSNNICFCDAFVECSVSNALDKLHCDFDPEITLSWSAIAQSVANSQVSGSLNLNDVNSGYTSTTSGQVPNTATLNVNADQLTLLNDDFGSQSASDLESLLEDITMAALNNVV